MIARKKTLLVVDDDPDSRVVLSRLLRQEGYRVVLARNGKEAMVRTQVVVPDLILLDVRMPVMDGRTFAELLRKRPALFGVPVIAISAHAEEDMSTMPVDARMRKPLDFERMLQSIVDLLRRGTRRARFGEMAPLAGKKAAASRERRSR